jgi:hypothetical protein
MNANQPPWNHYDIHGLVTLQCNRKDYFPDYFLTNKATANPDLMLYISNKNPNIPANFSQIGTDIFCSNENDQVFSKINLLGFRGMLTLKNLTGKPTEATVNNNYSFLSKTLLKVPMSTAFPDKAFAQMILHIKLLLKNHTFIVASCFQPKNQDKATLISSIGGMGKTSAIFQALNTFGGKYLADDMVIINGNGTIYAYPKPVRLRHITSAISLETYRNPAQILGSRDLVANSSPVGNLLLLERGNQNKITPLDSNEASKKILVITRKLLPYYMERTILAYSYMNSSFNLSNFLDTESQLQSSFLEHAKCYTLTSKIGSPNSIIKLMKEII